jgi:hypothetical protein
MAVSKFSKILTLMTAFIFAITLLVTPATLAAQANVTNDSYIVRGLTLELTVHHL